MGATREDFLVDEYKALRSEIDVLLAETRRLEIYSAGVAAGLFSWFVTQHVPAGVLWYVPLVVAALASVRAAVSYVRITQLGNYIRETEAVFLSSGNPIGWERTKRTSGLLVSGIVVWLLLLIGCGTAPSYLQPLGRTPTLNEQQAL